MNEDPLFSVIGAGRFGKLLASFLSKNHKVVYYDHNPDAIIEGCKKARLDDCLQADYIFLAIPISAIENFLKKNASKIPSGKVVVDVASVKVKPMEWLKTYLPENVYFAGSHPLFGPDSAKKGLPGHKIVLIPGRLPYDAYNFLVNLFEKVHGLEVLPFTPDEHDRLMAYNLSLVHHLGRAFHKIGIFAMPLKMAGLSKINSIAHVVMNDSETLFRDMYRFNPYADEVRQKFLRSFEEVSDLIKFKETN